MSGFWWEEVEPEFASFENEAPRKKSRRSGLPQVQKTKTHRGRRTHAWHRCVHAGSVLGWPTSPRWICSGAPASSTTTALCMRHSELHACARDGKRGRMVARRSETLKNLQSGRVVMGKCFDRFAVTFYLGVWWFFLFLKPLRANELFVKTR